VVAGAAAIRAPEALERVRQEPSGETGTVVEDLDAEIGGVRTAADVMTKPAGANRSAG